MKSPRFLSAFGRACGYAQAALFLLGTVASVGAEPERSTTAPATENSPAPAGASFYSVKRRSTFELKSGAAGHNPFWPIGWSPQAVVVAAPVVTKLDDKLFHLTSIVLGSGTVPALAVINGRDYREGEFIRAPRKAAKGATDPVLPGGAWPRVFLYKISDGRVELQSGEQRIIILKQAQELNQSRPDEQSLLNDDR